MAELELSGVAKRYGDAVALDSVSLTVADGEFFTLVGPSGCGKTTTLRLVAGLEAPSEGTVAFDGADVSDVPPEDRDVGLVFQNYALFPHMSVAENVRYGLKFRDPPGGVTPDERVAELLELVDLSGMGGRDPDNLSGGQQQRVALARALAPAPEVLLLDEPMSALDARLREQLRRQVKRIQGELGVTTVYVTHDQEEALAVSDRLAVMHDGRVEQVGTPPEVYESPASEFVAGFVGENNLFSGEVVDVERDGGSDAVGDENGGRDEGTVLTVDTAGGSFRVADPDGMHAVGDAVRFCVRPEALSVDATDNHLTATVDTVEYLGESTRVYGEWDGRTVVFRTREVPDGDELSVGFDPADATLL